MKTFFKINMWSVIITIFMYIIPWYGILAQIVLGAIQLISFFILSYQYKNFEPRIKKNWIIYFVATASLIILNSIKPDLITYSLWPISWVLAFYFLYILYQLKKTLS